MKQHAFSDIIVNEKLYDLEVKNLKPILDDYEKFEPAFYEISSGIKKMVDEKLRYLCKRKWNFKGWVTYQNCEELKFELSYNDKEMEETYLIQGYGSIIEQFILNEATFKFHVIEEHSEKAVSFEMDLNDKKELTDIEKDINMLLENNRSYRYFCEDYERYMKQGPLQYIKSLLINHLIDFEEETYDEGFGITYQYTGEFGEDSLEIVIDDSESDEEDACAFDMINVNVSDRFYFEFSEPYSKEIRALIPLLKQTAIPINDFLIRINSQYCINKEHHLHRIKALVCVDTGIVIKEIAAEAMFCMECNQYFISEVEYEKICRQGRICSRVITLAEYKKITESGYHSWAEKSLLRSYGYSVSTQEGLTDNDRRRILSFVIENGIMKPDEIVYFIEWLIGRNSSKEFYNARQKWSRDIEYVRNYKPIAGIVRVKDIYRKRFIDK